MTWEIIKYLDDVPEETLLRYMEHSDEARAYIIDRWPHIVITYIETDRNYYAAIRMGEVIPHISDDMIDTLIMLKAKSHHMIYVINDIFTIYSRKISKRAILYFLRYGGALWPEDIVEVLQFGGYDDDFIKAALATKLEYAKYKMAFILSLSDRPTISRYLTEHMVEYAICHGTDLVYSNSRNRIKQMLLKNNFSHRKLMRISNRRLKALRYGQ